MVLTMSAHASPPATAASPPPATTASKKARTLEGKRGRESTTTRPRRRDAVTPVWAYTLHNREVLILDATSQPSAAQINRLLRCRFTQQEASIPPALIARILEAAAHFERHQVMIVSGYRSPKLNRALRKKGRQVAATSQHTKGHAVDFYLPGVPTRTLYRWLLKHHDGGVGFYPVSEFVHIDTGRKRTWKGT